MLELSSASPLIQSKTPCPGNGATHGGQSPPQICHGPTFSRQFLTGTPFPDGFRFGQVDKMSLQCYCFLLYPGYLEAQDEFDITLKIPCARYWIFMPTPFSPDPCIFVLKAWPPCASTLLWWWGLQEVTLVLRLESSWMRFMSFHKDSTGLSPSCYYVRIQGGATQENLSPAPSGVLTLDENLQSMRSFCCYEPVCLRCLIIAFQTVKDTVWGLFSKLASYFLQLGPLSRIIFYSLLLGPFIVSLVFSHQMKLLGWL